MVRTQQVSARPGATPRGAVRAKPNGAGVVTSARRSTPPATSRTPPLLTSPRLSPASGGRLVASEPVQSRSTADPFSAYPRSGNLYDSPSTFLNRTAAGGGGTNTPAPRQSPAPPGGAGGGEYVVFSNSGKHMTRRPAGQGDASDSVAALLHGAGGGGGGPSGTLSAQARLPTGTGKVSGRLVHPASGPPTTVTRQNLLLSRKGRRSQEHLAPLRKEDLSLDPRKDTQRYALNSVVPATAGITTGAGASTGTGMNAWMERPTASPPPSRTRTMDFGMTSDALGSGGSGVGGDDDSVPGHVTGSSSAQSGGTAAGQRAQPLFSSLRHYTNQRLAQDQQNAAEYESGVMGGDGSRAFALSGGVGTPSAAAVARSRRLSVGAVNNSHNGTIGSSSSSGATAGYNPFLTTNALNYTGGRGSGNTYSVSPHSAQPRNAGGAMQDREDAALAAHWTQMPRELTTFGGDRHDAQGEPDEEELLAGAASMHRTVHPGDDTDHFFMAGDDGDEDYFEDPMTDAQRQQQAYDRESAAALVSPSAGSGAAGGKGKKKGAPASAVGKGRRKKSGEGPGTTSEASAVQPYDFRVVLSSGKTVSKPVQLTVGTGCVQGLRPTMEDEHVNKLNITTVREQPVSVVAILDGHCGRRVAELGAKYLPEYVCSHSALGENSALAIVESIVQADQSIYKACCGPPSPQQKSARSKLMSTQRQDFTRSLGGGGLSHDESGGSTLIAAVVHGRMLYVACLGDARAVLYDGRTTIAMSEDHKPNNAKEMKRINQCGGFVQFGRVCGVLAVSRALGDFEFKEQAVAGGGGGGSARPAAGKLHFRADKELMVSNIADVRQLHLTDESKFLILACDGLWDVISNEEATQFIRDFLLYTPEISDPMVVSGQKPRPSQAVVERVLNNCCRKLAEFAVSSGSTDNVSVTVLFFHDVVDIVASFGSGAGTTGSGGAPSATAATSARRTSLFSQSGRMQQRNDVIDNVLFGTSRGARSGSGGNTTMTNGRPVRHANGGGGARGSASAARLDTFFGGSFGLKANMSASRGVENTFSSGSRGLR